MSGRLSFSVAGRFSPETTRSYYRHQSHIGLHCCQRRNLSDGIFTRPSALRFISSILNSRTEDLYFELFGRSAKEDDGTFQALSGAISIRIRSSLADTSRFNAKDQIFACSYKLQRDGTCQFFAPKLSPNVVWNEGSSTSETTAYLMSQCYMFLKDMLHRHKHHFYTTDTIISLHPRHGPLSWKSRICYDLMRYVVKFTSGKTPKTYTNSLGTLAYLEAFSNLLSPSECEQTFSKLNIETLTRSLEAEKEKTAFITSQRLWVAGSMLPVLLAIAFYITPDDPTASSIITLTFISTFLVLSALVFTRIVPYQRLPTLVLFSELSLGLSKRQMGFLFLAMTVALIYISYLLLDL